MLRRDVALHVGTDAALERTMLLSRRHRAHNASEEAEIRVDKAHQRQISPAARADGGRQDEIVLGEARK